MKVLTRDNNNKIYSKAAKSSERVNPTSKLSLSIMNERLSLLNSDIEELYKKYIEKKKLRRKKEKNEQSLASRINFLIDEERKIRMSIENKIIKNYCSKNRSVKVLKTPEINTNSGTIRYNTIESSEDSQYIGKYNNNTTQRNKKINYINNLKCIEKEYEPDMKKLKLKDFIKKNGINDITLSSIQNYSSIENNNNITIDNKSNITNNVCIIINNSENNESLNNINKKNNFHDISFAERENNNNISNDNYYINTNNNNIKISENNSEEKFDDDNNNNINNFDHIEKEKKIEIENNNKISNEIRFIKMRLEKKINEDNYLKSISQTYQQNNDIIDNNKNKSNLNKNEMTEKKINYKDLIPEDIEDNIKTPSFKQKINTGKDIQENENKTMRDILNSKRKKINNLQKEMTFKKINKEQKNNKIDNKNKNNFNKRFIYIQHTKSMDKRCISRTDNKVKNKKYKIFNHNNINKTLNPNKSQIVKKPDKLNKRNNDKNKDNNFYKNLSIDSDEIILPETSDMYSSNTKQKKIEENKSNKNLEYKIFDSYIIKGNNTEKEKTKCDEKLYNECFSTPNLLQNVNLTFNQSIEKKRKLLGIPLNIKEDLNKRMENDFADKKKEQKKENKVKFIYIKKSKNIKEKNNSKENKTEDKRMNKYNPNNKSAKTIYDKKQKNKKVINISNFNSGYKDINYNLESYPYSNNETHNVEICKQLFKNNVYNKNKKCFENKEKNNINIASNSSLASLFSTQTNKTAQTAKIKNKNKIYNNDYLYKSNSNIYHINKSKKDVIIPLYTTKLNNKVIVKKQENKNYLNTIRLIKKRDKNNYNKENKSQNEEQQNNINKINGFINIIKINSNNKRDKNNNLKYYENEIKPRKELAVIRRINMKIENYKKYGPQIYQISKRHNNRFDENNNINNFNSNKKKNYQFHSYRRLNEIQKGESYSFSKNNDSMSVAKSKSNKSLTKHNRKFII